VRSFAWLTQTLVIEVSYCLNTSFMELTCGWTMQSACLRRWYWYGNVQCLLRPSSKKSLYTYGSMVVNIVAFWFHNCVFSAAHLATRLSGVIIASGLSCGCHADVAPTPARSASAEDSSQVAQQASSSADEVAYPLDDQQI